MASWPARRKVRIEDNLRRVRAELPEGVTLVAVSKFHPVAALRQAYDAGQRAFGESREAELRQKAEALPPDVEWHFIGHLQTNKVRYVVPYVTLIQSVDSERLLDEIERQARRCGRTVDVLLELRVAAEVSKTGFRPAEALALLRSVDPAQRWPSVRLRGVMGMASFVDDPDVWRHEFRQLHAAFLALRALLAERSEALAAVFDIRSYGMSTDRGVAVEEGATMVRVGTDIFGPRAY